MSRMRNNIYSIGGKLINDKDYYSLLAFHGARFMDENRPGWVYRIDTDLLDMAKSDACIFGQDFGWYEEGRVAVGLSKTESANFGFVINPVPGELSDEVHRQYSMLTEAWIREILTRL